MKLLLISLSAVLLLADVVHVLSSKSYADEARLYRDLLEGYDQWNPDHVLLPVYNTTDTQNVSFGLSLLAFLEYDTTSKVASFHTWRRLAWNDPFLKWDPSEYGNIHTLRLPASKIWMPDIVMFNEFIPAESFEDVLAVLSYDGSVLYIPRVGQKVLCTENTTNVSCKFKFGSWTFDGFRLDLGFYADEEYVDVNDYVPNGDYELVAHPAERHVKHYPCCDEPYVDLTFHLEFSKPSSGSWWGKK